MTGPRTSRRPTLLWHLLEEGSATIAALCVLTGWSRLDVHRAIKVLNRSGLLTVAREPGRRNVIYALTAAGIEEANKVERCDVHFAEQTELERQASRAAAEALGWQPRTHWAAQPPMAKPAPASAPAPAPDAAAPSAAAPAVCIEGWAAYREQAARMPAWLQPADPVYAVNSRGELLIEWGDSGMQLRLTQAHALALRRFLDNTSAVEEATP